MPYIKLNKDLPSLPKDAHEHAQMAGTRRSRGFTFSSTRSSAKDAMDFAQMVGRRRSRAFTFNNERPSTMLFFHHGYLSEHFNPGANAAIGAPARTSLGSLDRQKKDLQEDDLKDPSWLLVLSLFMSVFLSALDVTIVATALPTIADHIGTNATGFAWIGSAYLLAGAVTEPIWAKVSDIFGRRPVLLLANVVFLGGSVLCAISSTLVVLIVGRSVQGVGSGGLLVLVNVLIGDLFAPRKRGTYYGLIGLVWGVANAIGPLVGGVFADKIGWQWCFWVNVPCDGLALILTTFFLKVHTPHTPFWEGIKAIDWLGSLTVVGGTITLMLGLEFGGVTFPWDSIVVIILLVSGFMLLVAFFFIEAKVPKYPLTPLHIFKTVSNLSILAIDFSHGFVFIAGSYFLPVYFQVILGANALLSGLYLFPYVFSLSIAAVVTGQIIARTGSYNALIAGGMMLMTLGYALFIDFSSTASWAKIILFQIVAGTGVGPNFQSPMLALQNSVQAHEIGAATSTFGFVRQLANAVSIVFGNVLVQNQLASRKSDFVAAGIDSQVVSLLTGGSAVSSVEKINALPGAQRAVARAAFAASLQKAWLMYACVGIVGLGLTNFVRRRELSSEHVETKTGIEELERHRQARLAAQRGSLPEDLEMGRSGGSPSAFPVKTKSAEILGITSSQPSRWGSSDTQSWPAKEMHAPREVPSNRDMETERDRYMERRTTRQGAYQCSNLRAVEKAVYGASDDPLGTNARPKWTSIREAPQWPLDSTPSSLGSGAPPEAESPPAFPGGGPGEVDTNTAIMDMYAEDMGDTCRSAKSARTVSP